MTQYKIIVEDEQGEVYMRYVESDAGIVDAVAQQVIDYIPEQLRTEKE